MRERTCRMSRSAASRSISRVKQWQCTMGITSYTVVRSTPACDDEDDGEKMPRNASRNVIAESGRFMTKCAMRLRGGSCEVCEGGIKPCNCCRDCARRCDWESGGPEYPGSGSVATRIAACRMNSRPSSHDTWIRSVTCRKKFVHVSKDIITPSTDLVTFDIHDKIFVTLGIQIISQYGAALFRRR